MPRPLQARDPGGLRQGDGWQHEPRLDEPGWHRDDEPSRDADSPCDTAVIQAIGQMRNLAPKVGQPREAAGTIYPNDPLVRPSRVPGKVTTKGSPSRAFVSRSRLEMTAKSGSRSLLKDSVVSTWDTAAEALPQTNHRKRWAGTHSMRTCGGCSSLSSGR